jgi:DNA-binding transcriptional MerR regulator
MNGITYKDEPIKKIYWRISEVAERFHVAQSAIRFWLSEFHIEVRRNKKGDRLFTSDDIGKLEEVNFLLNVEGYTHWGAKRKLENL